MPKVKRSSNQKW